MAKTGSMAASRGSEAHKTVYAVGKFFGANFKPWGAVKIANVIGKVGTVLGVVGGILGVVGQIVDDIQQEKLRTQLRDARNQVRTAYRESAHLVEVEAWNAFEDFDKSFYLSSLQEIDLLADEITNKRTSQKTSVESLKAITRDLDNLLASVTS